MGLRERGGVYLTINRKFRVEVTGKEFLYRWGSKSPKGKMGKNCGSRTGKVVNDVHIDI